MQQILANGSQEITLARFPRPAFSVTYRIAFGLPSDQRRSGRKAAFSRPRL